jgi:hypothetical protein
MGSVGSPAGAGRTEWTYSPGGLLVPVRPRRYERPVAVDLFAGADGFSLGLHE